MYVARRRLHPSTVASALTHTNYTATAAGVGAPLSSSHGRGGGGGGHGGEMGGFSLDVFASNASGAGLNMNVFNSVEVRVCVTWRGFGHRLDRRVEEATDTHSHDNSKNRARAAGRGQCYRGTGGSPRPTTWT